MTDHVSSVDAHVRQLEAEPQPDQYAIMFGWLVRAFDGCNCAGGTPESSYLHEPTCGWEPVTKVEHLDAVGAVVEAARAWAAAPHLGHERAIPSSRNLLDAVTALDAP